MFVQSDAFVEKIWKVVSGVVSFAKTYSGEISIACIVTAVYSKNDDDDTDFLCD